MKDNKSAKLGIIVALLFLVVGFATISTVLNISGTTKIGANSKNLDDNVRFANTGDKIPTISDSTNATGGKVEISPDGKTLSFETPVLNNLNQQTTVSYYIDNKSQYDVKLKELTCEVSNSETPAVSAEEFLNIIPANDYNGLELASNKATDNPDTIVVELKKSYTGQDAVFNVTCTMNVEALQK